MRSDVPSGPFHSPTHWSTIVLPRSLATGSAGPMSGGGSADGIAEAAAATSPGAVVSAGELGPGAGSGIGGFEHDATNRQAHASQATRTALMRTSAPCL